MRTKPPTPRTQDARATPGGLSSARATACPARRAAPCPDPPPTRYPPGDHRDVYRVPDPPARHDPRHRGRQGTVAGPPKPDPDDPDIETDADDLADEVAAFVDAERDAMADAAQADAERDARIARDPRAKAAAVLGVRPDEVVHVRRKRAGLVVTTRGGTEMVIVRPDRPDRPDAEGRSGVLFWRRPPRYIGPSATYARTECADVDLCPHRPFAPKADTLAALARQRADAERVQAEAAKATKATPKPGAEPWAAGRAGDMYRTLLARAVEIEHALATLDAGTGMASMARQDRDAVRRLITAETNRLRSRYLVDHPPAPDPQDVAKFATIAMWAARMDELDRSAAPDRVIRAEHARLMTAAGPRFGFLAPTRDCIDREGAAAVKWLNGHGVPVPTADMEAPR